MWLFGPLALLHTVPAAEPAFSLIEAFVPYRNSPGPSDAEEPVSIAQSVGSSVCVLDFDLDGVWDLFFPDGGAQRLFRGRGETRFDDATARSGLASDGWSTGCSVADVDNDGDADLYVTRVGSNSLYRNEGDGTFDAISAGVEVSGWSTGAAFSDLDLDSLPDLYVAGYVDLSRVDLRARCSYFGVEVFCGPNGLPGAPDHLYRNLDGSRFQDVTRESGVRSSDAMGFNVLLADLDGDRLPEIHVANDAAMDLLFKNRGGFRFEDVSLLSGAGYSGLGMEQSGMGSTAGDFDSDGDLDLYVTNFQRDYNTLYRNEGGLSFQDVTSRAGLALPTLSHLGWGSHFLDVGNDGALDLFVANGHIYPELEKHPEVAEPYRQSVQLFLGDGGGGFREVQPVANPPERLGRGTSVADLDDDGAPDVVVNNLGGAPDLYRANSWKGNFLRLRLAGTASQRDGLGASVHLRTGSVERRRELRLSDGFLGSNEPVVHFGLGKERVSALEVRWPSGVVDRCEELAVGRTYWVKEGTGCLP
jgi:hypothetical protein